MKTNQLKKVFMTVRLRRYTIQMKFIVENVSRHIKTSLRMSRLCRDIFIHH